MNGPRISIVVLTHNRKTELLRTLTQLSDVRDIPIIVVDNASADGTADAVTKRFPRVELVRLSHNAGAAGRNAGVHAATTP